MESFTVSLPIPPRQLSPNSRNHWRVKHRHSKAYRGKCRDAVLSLMAEGSVCMESDWSESKLVPTYFHKDKRRRDRDNLSAMLKAAYDGIAEALGVDDYGFRPTMPEVDVDKDDPRVEIVVTVGDPPGDPSP